MERDKRAAILAPQLTGKARLACHAKIGPPKIGPARLILAKKAAKTGPPGPLLLPNLVRPDRFWLPKMVPSCQNQSPNQSSNQPISFYSIKLLSFSHYTKIIHQYSLVLVIVLKLFSNIVVVLVILLK